MEARYDVTVVGGGLLGLAAARALARRGREVVLLERDEVGTVDGGSKGSCRIFRLGYTDPVYVALARRARGYWPPVEDECGQRTFEDGGEHHPLEPASPGQAAGEGVVASVSDGLMCVGPVQFALAVGNEGFNCEFGGFEGHGHTVAGDWRGHRESVADAEFGQVGSTLRT